MKKYIHRALKISIILALAACNSGGVDYFLLTVGPRAEYRVFFEAVSDYARLTYAQMYPDKPPLDVTVEATHNGLLDPDTRAYYQQLNASSDVIGVSYYPLKNGLVQDPSVVFQHFADMLDLYPDKNLHFFQLGCPSSYYAKDAYPEYSAGDVRPVIESSALLQSDFIQAVFDAWDDHADRIHFFYRHLSARLTRRRNDWVNHHFC
jgi:hypothetical protein